MTHTEWAVFAECVNRRGSTFSDDRRKIRSRVRRIPDLEGILQATYDLNGEIVGENTTSFVGYDDFVAATEVFSEPELLEFLAGTQP